MVEYAFQIEWRERCSGGRIGEYGRPGRDGLEDAVLSSYIREAHLCPTVGLPVVADGPNVLDHRPARTLPPGIHLLARRRGRIRAYSPSVVGRRMVRPVVGKERRPFNARDPERRLLDATVAGVQDGDFRQVLGNVRQDQNVGIEPSRCERAREHKRECQADIDTHQRLRRLPGPPGLGTFLGRLHRHNTLTGRSVTGCSLQLRGRQHARSAQLGRETLPAE